MKTRIKINKDTQLAYIPDDIVNEGFVGEVEVLFNFNTGLLIRPGSTIDEQIRSVERLLEDLKDRKKALENNK